MQLYSIISRDWKMSRKIALHLMGLLLTFSVLTNDTAIGAETSDLVVQSVRVNKTTVTPGEDFQLDARIWNQGRAVSSATTLRYYLSTDEMISSEDTEVARGRVNALSGKGAAARRRRSDMSETLTAPETPGTHYYGVCIDAGAGETHTSNNCSEAVAITVEGPPSDPAAPQTLDPVDIQGPDLIISAARVEASTILLGEGVRLHITLTNQGTDRAPATTIRYYRSSDATITAEDTEIRAVPVGELGAGKSTTTWALLPGPTSLGVYYYGACLDAVVSEFDTSNNCSSAFRITVEQQGRAQTLLLPSGTIPPQALNVGDSPVTLNVMRNFRGRRESYTASSSDTRVLTAVMSGSEVTLTPVREGWVFVTIKVNSGNLTTRQGFSVSVGDPGIPNPHVVPDANLGVVIRRTLRLAENEPITRQQLLKLTQLYIVPPGQDILDRNNGIQNLTGLEHASNLQVLDLARNEISDITPLQNLTALTYLSFFRNEISDITPLQNLTALTELYLSRNGISDITPLKNLTRLTRLSLSSNRISDVTALENLTALTHLYLSFNQISDVTALENLTALTVLHLDGGNPIADLAPLRRLKERNPSVRILYTGGIVRAPNNIQESSLTPILPDETALLSNYPNPSNPETWIPYQLAETTDVTLTIYDLRGVVVRRLALGHQPAGFYQSRGRAAHWDGRNSQGEPVANGVYFYTLTVGDFTATRKLLILK